MEDLHALLQHFDPIDLAGLKVVDFPKRIDTKFIFPEAFVPEILKRAQSMSRVLEVDGERLIGYNNVYLDTAEYDMFFQHHRGKLNRYKLRLREYSTGAAFAEVKFKSNKKLTRKFRTQIASASQPESEKVSALIDEYSPYNAKDTASVIDLTYTRVTLASNAMDEKFTLDVNLHCKNNKQSKAFEGLAIAEIKQPKLNVRSSFYSLLKEFGFKKSSFSKYCMCMATLHPELKQNRFKPILSKLNTIAHGVS